MKTSQNEKQIKEKYPFRKLAYATFIKGGILFILGIVLLLAVKNDFKQGHYVLFTLKLSSGLIFLIAGLKLIVRGYKSEYDFSLKDIFDKTRNIEINNLLGQRKNVPSQLTRIFRSISFSSSKEETHKVDGLKYLIFKLFSKKEMSDIFDYAPYPISKFIENQLKPIKLIGFFIVILLIYSFLNYLEVIPFGIIWINLFILVGLLSLWYPSKIDYLTKKDNNYKIGKRIFYFILFYSLTVFIYKPNDDAINYVLILALVALVIIILYTSYLSFKLIHTTFSSRKEIKVTKSVIALNNRKIGRQPSFLLTQFDNVIDEKVGWYYKGSTKISGGNVAGDQKHKGSFAFDELYETNPQIVSTSYTENIEKKLGVIYVLGIILFSIGSFILFFGIMNFPNINMDTLSISIDALIQFAPEIMWSLFLILFGTSLYFIGNRFVYDIFLFFNTEIFFESNIILFDIKGSYDQYKHDNGQTKETNTSTDFTPDIQVSKVISSIFIHPYLESDEIKNLPRFISKIEDNDPLLDFIIKDYSEKLAPYLMNVNILNNGNNNNLEGENKNSLN